MNEVQSPAAQTAGLTQIERVTNAFIAPSKTFEDIKRGHRSWWLPLILLAVFTYLFFAVVSQKVGMQQVVDNQIRMNSKAQEQLAQVAPEQRERANKISMGFTEGALLAGPLLGMLGAVIVSMGLLGTMNFVFGGRAKYGDIFAVTYYAWLPSIVKSLLGMIVIYAGMAPEAFNIRNFAPTNPAALFMDPASANKALYALASSFDIVTIWILVLLGMGIATVAGVKRSSGYIAVFGWWAIFVLIGVGWAAAFS